MFYLRKACLKTLLISVGLIKFLDKYSILQDLTLHKEIQVVLGINRG